MITAMAGYVAAPGAFDLATFLAVSAGTCMCSAAANAVNQTMEVPYDAQMARTRSRVLVRAQLRWGEFPLDARSRFLISLSCILRTYRPYSIHDNSPT